jgi:hypothetical protein
LSNKKSYYNHIKALILIYFQTDYRNNFLTFRHRFLEICPAFTLHNTNPNSLSKNLHFFEQVFDVSAGTNLVVELNELLERESVHVDLVILARRQTQVLQALEYELLVLAAGKSARHTPHRYLPVIIQLQLYAHPVLGQRRHGTNVL